MKETVTDSVGQEAPYFCEEFEAGDKNNCIGLGMVQCLKCAASKQVPTSQVAPSHEISGAVQEVEEFDKGGMDACIDESIGEAIAAAERYWNASALVDFFADIEEPNPRLRLALPALRDEMLAEFLGVSSHLMGIRRDFGDPTLEPAPEKQPTAESTRLSIPEQKGEK